MVSVFQSQSGRFAPSEPIQRKWSLNLMCRSFMAVYILGSSPGCYQYLYKLLSVVE